MESLRIKKIGTSKLHGEEHFQFITDFIKESELAGIIDLVPDKHAELAELYEREDALLEIIRKSPLTEKLEKIDSERDVTYTALREIVKGMRFHYEPQKREAAASLMLVFNTYGNLHLANYVKQTGLMYNFLQEVSTNYAKDIATLELDGWISKLEELNQTFSDLRMERTRKEGEKPKFNMSEIKARIDDCYGDIVRCLEATAIMQKTHKLEPFFNTINKNVDKYKNVIAQREGRAAANAAKKGEPEKEIIEEPEE
jgi:hypothetical protein